MDLSLNALVKIVAGLGSTQRVTVMLVTLTCIAVTTELLLEGQKSHLAAFLALCSGHRRPPVQLL
jgi:hypothetical protein